MKRSYVWIAMALGLVFSMALPQTASANMAAPAEPDRGYAITFEQNQEIGVLSEVLDIQVTGSSAHITAIYHMQNLTSQTVTTESMFLSPNIQSGNVEVLVDGETVEFQAESYELNWSTEVDTQDWQYVVLTEVEDAYAYWEGQTLDAVTFSMTFEPDETYDVVVSYDYLLGGYPEYDFDAKRGELLYYLTPAAMWNGFESLTINLYLDEEMPVLKESSLEFEKLEKGVYQYVSDTLPEEELRLTIDENWIQNIGSTLRSPYLMMNLVFVLPVILIVAVIVILMLVIRHHRKKKKSS